MCSSHRVLCCETEKRCGKPQRKGALPWGHAAQTCQAGLQPVTTIWAAGRSLVGGWIQVCGCSWDPGSPGRYSPLPSACGRHRLPVLWVSQRGVGLRRVGESPADTSRAQGCPQTRWVCEPLRVTMHTVWQLPGKALSGGHRPQASFCWWRPPETLQSRAHKHTPNQAFWRSPVCTHTLGQSPVKN